MFLTPQELRPVVKKIIILNNKVLTHSTKIKIKNTQDSSVYILSFSVKKYGKSHLMNFVVVVCFVFCFRFVRTIVKGKSFGLHAIGVITAILSQNT